MASYRRSRGGLAIFLTFLLVINNFAAAQTDVASLLDIFNSPIGAATSTPTPTPPTVGSDTSTTTAPPIESSSLIPPVEVPEIPSDTPNPTDESTSVIPPVVVPDTPSTDTTTQPSTDDSTVPTTTTPTTPSIGDFFTPVGGSADTDPITVEDTIDQPFGAAPQSPSNKTTTTAPVPVDPSNGNLPPAPPAGWKFLPVDTAIIFPLELQGLYIAPWTSPKSYIVSKTLSDRYLRAVDMKEIDTQSLGTYFFLDFDAPGGSRGKRKLLQTEKSGAKLKVTVKTNFIRVESEIAAVAQGALSGSLAEDLTLMGIHCDNATIWEEPQVIPITKLTGKDDSDDDSSSIPVWGIAAVVAVVLIILPVPIYCLVKWRKRKHREAVERQADETAAARARMQSRIIKPSGKSFTVKPGENHHIMVRAGSIKASQPMSTANSRQESFIYSSRDVTRSNVPLSARGAALGAIAPNGQRVPSLTGQVPFVGGGYGQSGRLAEEGESSYSGSGTDRSYYDSDA